MNTATSFASNSWITAAIGILALIAYRRLVTRGQRLPPGPRGWPVIGSALDIPKEFEWLTFQRWSREFGSDLLYYTSWGRPHVLINSSQIASDLLEKRSTLYSDRPRMPMLNELVGFDWDFAFMPYKDDWKDSRKAFTQHFRPTVVPKYRDIEIKQSRQLILDLLETPHEFDALARSFAGKIIIPIVYGIDVQKKDDPYVAIAQKALYSMNMTGNVGTYLVDLIPALKYLPAWCLGAGFQREAREWRKYAQAMLERPTEAVKKAMKEGTARPSMMISLLDGLSGNEDPRAEWIMSSAAATAYEGGSETIYSVVSSFVLAMLMHPEVQRKAHDEMDRVLGGDRMPEFADQGSMPYLTAIYKEVLRYRPVLPLAIMRRVSADDTYRGYYIPRGATVVVNSWAMLHDERVYSDPGSFRPERFLTDKGELDPDAPDPSPAFGFGRRVCPGMYMAADSVWIACAMILWAFDIEKPVDESGKVMDPIGGYTFGLVCYPAPFECIFKPRWDRMRDRMSRE